MNERGMRVAGSVLLAFVAVWAGVRVYVGHRDALAAVAVPVGRASPPTADAFDTVDGPAISLPKIPDRLPDFALSDLQGKPIPIATYGDKSLIINFWATWCAPCRHEIPLLEAVGRDWKDRDIQVVGIAVDHPESVRAYAAEMKIDYPLLVGEQDALDVAGSLGFDAPVFPFTVFTDRKGNVVTLFVGELHREQAELILSVVQNLNQKHVPLDEARRSIADRLHGLAPQHPG